MSVMIGSDVVIGTLADIDHLPIDVRYWGQSGHAVLQRACPLMTQSGHLHRWIARGLKRSEWLCDGIWLRTYPCAGRLLFAMDQIIKYVLDDMRVLGDAPVVFAGAILIIAGAIWWALSWRYSGIIRSKERTIALYKHRLGGASPDEAKAKIDSLEGQIWTLKNRVWPRLAPETIVYLETSLKTKDPPQQIVILPQDMDSIFLARDLVDAFTRIGWPAKQDSSMYRVPDGLSVWPDIELSRAIGDVLLLATGAPVAIREDKYAPEHGNIVIGIGYKAD